MSVGDAMTMNKNSNKVKRFAHPFFRFVFGRSMITVVLLLIQVGYLIAGFLYLGRYMNIVIEVLTVLAALLIVHLVNDDENPAYKMSWMVLILSMPVLGATFYLFVKCNLGHRWVHDTMKKNIESSIPYLPQNTKAVSDLMETDKLAGGLSTYLYQIGHYPTYYGDRAEYFPDGMKMKQALLADLAKAQKFIFIEYFIVDDGNFWEEVLQILKDKSNAGIEVRFMYDGMCSLVLLPFRYPKTLEAFGIHAKMYAPIRPLLSTHQNNRDHRKIVVVDGKCAFTGGINLADEYTNEKEIFGYWKDCAVRVEGSSVRSFTAMFLQMWNAEVKPMPDRYGEYIEATSLVDSATVQAGCFVIPYGDGPYSKDNLAENVYMHILQTAVNYVHIMTPYLILDHELLMALLFAAKRGVEVSIILPHIPDKKIPFSIARSYYTELIQGGVQIYEFTEGFVHAKVMTADDKMAVVGSINFDYRSLYLHFEDGVYFYKHPVINEIEKDYQHTIHRSQKISIHDYKKFRLSQRMMGRVFRLFGPLM